MPPKTPKTPKERRSLYAESIDVQNVNAIFLIKRIRNFKSTPEMLKHQSDYDWSMQSLNQLEKELSSDPYRLLLKMRTWIKRVRYLQSYLKTEWTQKLRQLRTAEAAAARAEQGKTKLNFNVKLLAKYIINESVQLSKRFAPREESMLRFSTVPEDKFTNSHLLAAALSGEVSLSDENEINLLERMDENL